MPNRILSALIILLACLSARNASATNNGNSNTTIPLLRLKLVLDDFNTDDIAIGFLSTATTRYNYNLDSGYLPGINALLGLSSLSSDNVPLSVNIVPLPGQAPLAIRLDVEAANSGAYTLQQTELDSIPAVYDIWLKDNYSKDSINLRETTNYAFNITKSDTNSFGAGRFQVVIRQSPLLSFHLLNFDAVGETGKAKVTWSVENEQNDTHFAVERSIDGGVTFLGIDTLTSAATGYYTYLDKTPVSGSDSYRLKTTDMNGVISYSNIVTLSFNTTETATKSAINIYPNPSNGVINLAINGGDSSPTITSGSLETASVRSYAPVIRSATSSSATWQGNVTSLSPGTYVVEVVNNSNSQTVGRSTFIKL
jgi:hypothetical protein